MKRNAVMLLAVLIAASASGQITAVPPHVQDQAKDQLNSVQQQQKAASDAALQTNSTAKAPAGKPSAATAATKSGTAPASTKPATVSAKAPTAAVKPLVVVNSKAPATSVATAKAATTPAAVVTSKPTSPAISKAAPAVTQKAVAQNTPVAPTAAKPVMASKPVNAKAVAAVAAGAVAATAIAASASAKSASAAKKDPFASAAKPGAKSAQATAADKAAANAKAADDNQSEQAVKEETRKEAGFITAGNRRDPFVNPIVEHVGGSGCSTGKRCLAIDQISLRGIVKSDAGMIAVVVNSLDKAYFLRENDPVFNGYVLKISGDSVVFKETVQDKLGHLSTREVVKKITTPAV